MAGHSKWSQIKRKKAHLDSKRGQAFTKLIKEITVCARNGGGDPDGNARLRLLLEKAKEINMPLENSLRAIKRGTGELPGVHYEEMTYEGHGPENCSVIVEVLTDNKNRTVAEFRRLFTENGGRLGDLGSVSWQFEKFAVIHVPLDQSNEEQLFESLLDFNIADIKATETEFIIYAEPKNLDLIKKKLQEISVKPSDAEIEWVAKDHLELSEKQYEKVYAFLDALHNHDDVKNLYTNAP